MGTDLVSAAVNDIQNSDLLRTAQSNLPFDLGSLFGNANMGLPNVADLPMLLEQITSMLMGAQDNADRLYRGASSSLTGVRAHN